MVRCRVGRADDVKMARRAHSPGSLAGWLFADLTLVLAVAFIANTGNAFTTPPSVSTTTTTTTTTSTTTTVPCVDGSTVRPDPVEFRLVRGSSLGTASLHARLDDEIAQRLAVDPDLASLAGTNELTFGVIILYGGSNGRQNEVGDRAAERAQERLTTWAGILPTTYFETGHDSGASPGTLTFKMFPVLLDPCEVD